MTVVPLTLGLIFVLLYLNTKSAARSLLGYAGGSVFVRRRILVFVGPGLQHERWSVGWDGSHSWALMPRPAFSCFSTSIVAVEEWKRQGWLRGKAGLREAIVHGAVKRIRPQIHERWRPCLWASHRCCCPTGGGFRCDEADRSSNDWWNLYVLPAGADCGTRRSMKSGGGVATGEGNSSSRRKWRTAN